jgi:hypothetical protein
MRRFLIAALLLCLPVMVGAQDFIRYYPAGGGTCADTLLAKAGPNLATQSTSEETLYLISIPAGHLSADGDTITVMAMATTAANTNAKYLRLRWNALNGTIIGASATTSSAANIGPHVRCMRTSSSTMRCLEFPYGAGTGSTLGTHTALTGIDFTAALTIHVAGTTATSAGELTLIGVSAFSTR